MSASRIAKRYALPLYDLARENDSLDLVKSDMDNFLSICKSNKDFVTMLRSPIIAHFKKADILKKIFEGKVDNLTLKVIEIITRKNRENLLSEIAEEFIKLYNDYMGYQEATVTTTFALDSETRKTFEKVVTEISGKKPLLKERVDSHIIGGYILMLGDRQIDDSVSGALKDLKLKFQ